MLEAARPAPRAARWARPSGLRRCRRALIGTASVTAFLAAWQLVALLGLARSDLISSPAEVVRVGASLSVSGELPRSALISLQEFVFGFIPALAVGILLGLAMGQSRRLRYLLEPSVMAFYSMPRIALIPLLVIWFGIGMESKIVVVFLGAVFPVLVNTLAGVQQIDLLWIRAARGFGANGIDVLTKVVLPGALPAVMTGIRLGLGRAIISVIVAEMYVSLVGMGHLIQVYGNAGRAAELIALAMTVALFGLVCVSTLRWLEDRIGPWRRELEL